MNATWHARGRRWYGTGVFCAFLLLFPTILHTAAPSWTRNTLDDNSAFGVADHLAVADFDEDGDLDVIVADGGDEKVWWYANNGSATFTRNSVDANFTDARDVSVLDVDKDGDLDILGCAGDSGDKVAWFDNDGTDLSFTERSIDDSANGAISCRAADFDGDGDWDVVAAIYSEQGINWYQNNGSQVFTEIPVTETMTSVYTVYPSDLDDDGDMDFVAAGNTSMKWFRNDGTGTFTEVAITTTSRSNIAVADVDGDGDKDIVTGTTTLYWHDNNGSETFTERTACAVTYGTTSKVVDMNNDGDMDIVNVRSGAAGGNNIQLCDNDGSESFTVSTVDTTLAFAKGIGTGDVNGDSILDIVSGDQNMYWFSSTDTAPSVSTLSPADDATNVSFTTNLVLTFDETTRAGTGTLTIKQTSNDATVETITVSGALLSGNGTTELTLDPSTTLASNTSYYVVWEANAFKDTAGLHAAVQTSTTYWSFTTLDTTEPSVSTLSPTDNATNVLPTANLVITFDKTTRAGTGTLTIKQTSNDATVETITVSGALLSGNGTTELTLNPATTLEDSTQYYVVWEANAFKNTSNVHAAAQSSTTSWNFTTGDYTAPTVSTLSPADNATDVSLTANLIVTFNENVRAGTGTLTIKKTDDDSTVETITVSGALLSGNGTTQLTFNPATTLDESTGYYIVWEANAFKDTSVNTNHATAVTASTTWNFTTTGAAPAFSNVTASAGSTSATITWTTDENASTRIHYGLTSALGSATSETDTGAGTQSHEVALSSLPACTTYHYRPISSDPFGNTATGTLTHFTTTGCTASATVSSQTGSTITTAGGSLDMATNGSGTALTVPAAATTNPFALQIKKLDKDTVIATTSTPDGVSVIGDHIYDLRAISGATVVTSFLQAITVTMEYTDAQASDYTESTLLIYRWNGSSWSELSGCSVDEGANTVTCTTTAFSTFGLFGRAAGASSGHGGRGSLRNARLAESGAGGAGSSGSPQAAAPAAPAITEAFRPSYDHYAAMLSEAQKRTATPQELSPEHRRTLAIKEALIARFQESTQRTQAQRDEQRAFQDLVSKRGSTLLSSTDRRFIRAQVKTVVHAAAPPLTALEKVAERRGFVSAIIDDVEVLYTDVPSDAWYAPYVSTLLDDKIVEGYRDGEGKPTGQFGAANPVTFAEALKMSLEATEEDLGSLPPPRNPSARGTWASPFAAKAEAARLSVFTPSVDVHAPATRGAVVQTILEVLGLPIADRASSFSDVPADHPYAKAIATAAFYGLITGDTDDDGHQTGMVRPDDPINRAEVAKIIALVRELKE